MAIVYLILALLIAVIAVIFAWQNPATITVTFFAWKAADVPLSLVLLATLAIGIVIGWLFVAPSLVRHTFRASGNRKRIGALEKDLEDHKSKLSELQNPAPVAPKSAAPTRVSDTDPLQHS
jgi:putative membrane protein